MTDPWLSYFGHPVLPAGYNADDNNGDEVDGAGTNWPIWPVLFDTFEGLTAIVVTEDMMALFDTACPDFIAPVMHNTIVYPAEDSEALVRNVWTELVLPGQNNVIIFPREARSLTIKGEGSEAVLAPAPNTVEVPAESRTVTVRRKA